MTRKAPDLSHLSRNELESLLVDAMDYISEAKAAAGDRYYSGRPLPDLIREWCEDLATVHGDERVHE